MARYKGILAYDGTDFFGFQRQPEIRTVQGVVEQALHLTGWRGNTILAAGRTDTGVHAKGQVIAFDLEWSHQTEDLQNAINSRLSADVSLLNLELTEAGFHPRYDAFSRRYQYRIICQSVRDPLRERYAWRLWPPPDEERMRRASNDLIGEHDFRAYGSPSQPDRSPIRKVLDVRWAKSGDDLMFEITANGFLYHMVRRIMVLLVGIGQGKHRSGIVRDYLENPAASSVQGLAPANGLCLVEVCY